MFMAAPEWNASIAPGWPPSVPNPNHQLGRSARSNGAAAGSLSPEPAQSGWSLVQFLAVSS